MIINLITLATVKTQLGLTDGTYDAAITAMIPLVSNDIRRILNCNYDIRYVAAFNNSAATIDFGVTTGGFYNPPFDSGSKLPFTLGQVIYHPDIAEDTYLSSYNPDDGLYTMTATPSDTGTWAYPTVQISQWPAISKMIWYKTTVNNTDSVNKEILKSYRVGPISKTYSDSEINKQWDYPQTVLNDLGFPYAEVG
jgi:hypothetical protein